MSELRDVIEGGPGHPKNFRGPKRIHL